MNLVQKAIEYGGKIVPLIIENSTFYQNGYMNPSVFIDKDGDILVNLRHINYTLYHSESDQNFPTAWGPLAYLHPENDINLRTKNYLCRLDDNFNIINETLIDTSELDVVPLWEFVGLEDGRLVQWNNEYFIIGVRRDTTPHGEGRMEYSKIELDKNNWIAKEVYRKRIDAPAPNTSYCEKNWVPVLDKPYHFIKWTYPTELVYKNPYDEKQTESLFVKEPLSKNTPQADLRGGSHIVKWKKNYISVNHEVYLYKNYLGQKDGIYRHRLCVWDKNFNLIGISKNSFSFLDAKIEFCSGAAKYNNSLLLSFGFQDNASYLLQVPESLIDIMIDEAIGNE